MMGLFIYVYIYSLRNKNVHISVLIKRKEVKGEWKELQTDDSQMTKKSFQYEIYSFRGS